MALGQPAEITNFANKKSGSSAPTLDKDSFAPQT
jgi:hypothetical protein